MDADLFRRLMGNFATGVTVVTTAVDGRLHGFTANAVTSVSLDPLLFLVCVDNRAHALKELEHATHFGVSMLAEGQAEVSNIFAKTGPPEMGTLRSVPFHPGETGVPLVDGSIACLECEVTERIAGGDHTIVIGRVVAGCHGESADPLLFFRGRYRRVGD